MRLHSLLIEGFGPFKSKQQVDFDKLAVDRFFMLEGPTGSGKSSIIDAIVFALYGDTAQLGAGKAASVKSKSESDRLTKHRIRSDYAELGDSTEVTLEFSNANGRFRIHRIAEMPKKKRDGTIGQSNQEAKLIFIKPEALPITRVSDVNLRIRELVGLDVEQFTQLVVLPQGRFTTFLHADRNARQEILSELFKTFFYEKFEEELASRRKAIDEQLKQSKFEIEHHVKTLMRIAPADFDVNWEEVRSTLINDAEVRSVQDPIIEYLTGEMYVDVSDQSEKVTAALAQQDLLNDEKNKLDELVKAISELAKLKKQLAELQSKDDLMQQRADELKMADRIEPLLVNIEQLEEAEKALKSAERRVKSRFKDLSVKEIQQQLKKAKPIEAKLKLELSKNEDIAEQMEALRDRIDAAVEVKEAKLSLEAAKKQLPTLEKAYEKANQALTEYKKNRKNAGASVLVKQLKPGKPCPVCGSTTHPKKATGPGYDENQETKLEVRRDHAKYELDDCKSEIKQFTPMAKRTLQDVKALEAKLKAMEKLEETLGDKEAKLFDLEREIEDLENALEIVQEVEKQQNTVESLMRPLSAALAKYDVEKISELKKIAAKDSSVIREQIDTHKSEKIRITGLIAQDKYQNVPPLEKVSSELADMNKKLSAVKSQLEELNKIQGAADSQNKLVEESKSGIMAALDTMESIRAASGPLMDLESVVKGQGKNRQNLTLERYVLQEKLEIVLERASAILYQISNGKYEFRVQTEKLKGHSGREAGLGITVLDLYSGKDRPAETLSGGESFYASLALALGLAEVVRAERGGIELGTLFIDEGFGSLDEVKLDEVLEVFERLVSTSNRIIGVISHVESMKARIPVRLEIRATSEGPSTVKLVGV
jgi:exonuclease SbcC